MEYAVVYGGLGLVFVVATIAVVVYENWPWVG